MQPPDARGRTADPSILVCFALDEEAAPFQRRVARKPGIAILITGIGRRNAEKSLRAFLAAHLPELVVTCGFAGGLSPDLKLGEVVFEPAILDSQFSTRLLAAGAKPVKFLCADCVATTSAEKKKLRVETGADAVEMESTTIQAVCREHGIPSITVRVISDTAEEDLPLDFNQVSKPDQSLDYGKLFLALSRSPRTIGSLMELRKKIRFAAEQLAVVLAGVISP